MVGVQNHQIGQCARCHRAGIAAECLGSSRDGLAVLNVRHVSAARFKAPDVFEPTQFLDRAGAYVRIAAEAEAAAVGQELTQRKDAVAEVGFRRLA